MRCGTTIMSVSALYLFGRKWATTAVTIVHTMKGTIISHLRRHAIFAISSTVYVFPGSTLFPSLSELRHEDRIVGFELDILLEVLPVQDVLVIEREIDGLAVDRPHDGDVFLVGVLEQSASRREQLQHRHRCRQRVRPGPRHLPNDIHTPAGDLLDH